MVLITDKKIMRIAEFTINFLFLKNEKFWIPDNLVKNKKKEIDHSTSAIYFLVTYKIMKFKI